MTRKERVIKIFKKLPTFWFYDEYDEHKPIECYEKKAVDEVINEILSLSLDVPSDEEIRHRASMHAGVPLDDPEA